MTLSFFKLHLAASSHVVIDRSRNKLAEVGGQELAEIARLLLSPHLGCGGRTICFIDDKWPSTARAFLPNGSETFNAEDAFICAARLAFDSGRIQQHAVSLSCPDRIRNYRALASGTLSANFTLPSISSGPTPTDSLKALGVQLFTIAWPGTEFVLALSPPAGPSVSKLKKIWPSENRERPFSNLILTKVCGRGIVQFICTPKLSRLLAASASALAAQSSGFCEPALIVEWAGPHRAVRYAQLSHTSQDELITRGRFWCEKKEDSLLIAGSPEYAIEGSIEIDL